MRRTPLGLVMLCVLSAARVCGSTSAPESPRQFDCRSREKETFFCWWEPGSDGGLPTEYRLFYEIENLRGVHECPDYVSAGENSCFFDKKHTSFWAEYIMTVVATNALGNASAQFQIPDVMTYLKPDPPVNVTVVVNTTAPSPFLEIRWKSPPNVDVRSGWVTPKYELRVKQNDSKEWKTVDIGAQTSFNFHNVEPGLLYMAQVRCNLDHGKWSEWSNTIFAKIPKYRELEKYFWIFVFVFSLIPLLTAIYILVLKRKVVKQCLLPPVPGPKIKGVDVHLLKSGQTEDVVNALTRNQNFPPMVAWMEEAEDFLLVSDSDEWLLTNSFTFEKKKDIFIIPAGLHLGLEIQHRDSTVDLNTWEKTDDGKEETKSNFLNTEPINLPVEKQECLNGEEVSIQPLANTSYVDIQQRPTLTDYRRVKEVNGDTILILNEEEIPHCSDAVEVKREMSVPNDYSRVKEVNSDVVFLEKGDSAEEYCKKKEDHYTDWTNQKPVMPHESELSKGFSLKMIANGYIDSVPTFSVK
ncbi:prolactin receptor b isoform X2 [Poeciliopsis prolifica]|uniref:prolactin receptor b isoform X2 n=1 Tax=Poeciliopsis prolifica TaxID=188132 RepID=UPI0024139F3F|nr:prolactin receptor b isoform X2 [Poeciliopsis prolifica]